MQIPIQIDAASTKSLQRQLIDQIKLMVMNGILPPGTKIPSSRALSAQLNVARNTVLLAYEHLMAEGYAESRSASATCICKTLPDQYLRAERIVHREPGLELGSFGGMTQSESDSLHLYSPAAKRPSLEFRVGWPDASLFPSIVWRRLVNECLGAADRAIADYADPAGY